MGLVPANRTRRRRRTRGIRSTAAKLSTVFPPKCFWVVCEQYCGSPRHSRINNENNYSLHSQYCIRGHVKLNIHTELNNILNSWSSQYTYRITSPLGRNST